MKKISVTLRSKTISGGRKSLYLDFYPAITDPKTGLETRREFLKLYIYDKPKGFSEKLNNSENLRMAEMICTRRRNEVNKEFIYTPLNWSSYAGKKLHSAHSCRILRSRQQSVQGKAMKSGRAPYAILKTS